MAVKSLPLLFNPKVIELAILMASLHVLEFVQAFVRTVENVLFYFIVLADSLKVINTLESNFFLNRKGY